MQRKMGRLPRTLLATRIPPFAQALLEHLGDPQEIGVVLRNLFNCARDMAARLRSLGFSVIERDNL